MIAAVARPEKAASSIEKAPAEEKSTALAPAPAKKGAGAIVAVLVALAALAVGAWLMFGK